MNRLQAFQRRSIAAASLAAAICVSSAAPPPPPAWQEIPGARWTPIQPVASSPRPGFNVIPSDASSIAFTNHLAEASAANNRILENGSGVALGDVDGDGWTDIYLARLEGDNALYRSLGNWRFEDITTRAQVGCPGQASTGALLADADGDGDLDLLVNAIGGGTRLFLNDGTARFIEVTDSRLVRRFGASSMAMADMDADGDLDLYVANYRTDTFRDDPPGLRVEAVRQADGSIKVSPEGRFIPVVPPGGAGVELIERGERDFLYLNQGGARLAPVSWTSGAFLDESGQPLREPPADWGLAVQFRDFTGDGHPDLYVCNDFASSVDRIWISESGRRFRAAPRSLFSHLSLSSMSVDVADINRDGRDDLFVADMLSRRAARRAWQRPNTLAGLFAPPVHDPAYQPEVTHNTLHLARDDGSFAEIACFAGVASSEWSWSGIFLDVDLDGWEDLLLATGNGHDVQHADTLAELSRMRSAPSAATRLANLRRFPALPTPLLAFRNQHDRTFADASQSWNFQLPGVHTGMALGDLDNDGDLDVVANHLNGPVTLLRNDTAAPRIAIRLRGAAANTRGIGARIRVLNGPVPQSQEMIAGGRYLSSDDPIRTFAAGTGNDPLTIEVTWRSGRVSRVSDARPGRIYEIIEPSTSPEARIQPAAPKSWLAPVPLDPPHRHQPVVADESSRQSLLPRAVVTRSPAVGWIDLNADGTDEWIVAGGHGQPDHWRRLDAARGWVTNTTPASPSAGPTPRNGIAVLTTGAPGGWLVACDSPEPGPSPVLRGGPGWEGIESVVRDLNPGALAAADLDGDGQLELFVGDRGIPGQWPAPAPSRWFTRRNGRWTEAGAIDTAGLVTGALFTDIDLDGDADLVTASEAGPVRLWRNDRGSLAPAHCPGLDDLTGWWQCLAAADFNADGLMDLVAGNWGDNWRPEPVDPNRSSVRLAWADFAGHGRIEPVLASWDPVEERWFPRREWKALSAALPWVPVAYPSHAAYANARFEELLAGKPDGVRKSEVQTSRSTLFLNRGQRFEPIPLPAEAQWTSANAIVAGDLDGDGHVDLALSQNLFRVDPETTRQDVGLGLVLAGDGTGHFRALGPAESGVRVPGEGRGLALADADRDGRLDLLMGVHGGESRLWKNVAARPGIRVRLRNPAKAVGTRMRWVKGSSTGPLIELRAGNGSGSQDSLIPVVTGAPEGAEIEVTLPAQPARRWPAKGPELTVD